MNEKITGREFGEFAREQLLREFKENWGDFEQLAGISLFRFPNGNKLLTLYSSLNNDKWFYGVSEQHWRNWDEKTYMVLLLGDEEKCDYVILNPKESQDLLRKIQPAHDNQKKINIRIPSSGSEYITEWPSFRFKNRVKSLGIIETKSGSLELKINKQKLKSNVNEILQIFQNLSESEKKAIFEKLQKKLA